MPRVCEMRDIFNVLEIFPFGRVQRIVAGGPLDGVAVESPEFDLQTMGDDGTEPFTLGAGAILADCECSLSPGETAQTQIAVETTDDNDFTVPANIETIIIGAFAQAEGDDPVMGAFPFDPNALKNRFRFRAITTLSAGAVDYVDLFWGLEIGGLSSPFAAPGQ